MTCTSNELAGFLQNAHVSVISVAHIISDIQLTEVKVSTTRKLTAH